jgi:hypothetical protein
VPGKSSAEWSGKVSQSLESIVRRAYGEALLVAMDKGLTGPRARQAAMKAAAKVAGKLTGQEISIETVNSIVHEDEA